MAAEREQVRRDLGAQTPDGAARDQPRWKRVLLVGTKWEKIIAGLILLFGLAYMYDRRGPLEAAGYAAMTTAALFMGAWGKRQQKAEEERTSVLGLRDPGPGQHATRR